MTGILRKFRNGLRFGFRRDRRGATAIEFSLALPALGMMLVGSVELISYTWAVGRVQDAAGAVGDLTTQNTAVDEGSMDAIFGAAESMIALNSDGDASINDVEVTVTSALACYCNAAQAEADDPDFCYEVLWSHLYDGNVNGGRPFRQRLNFVPSDLAVRPNDTLVITEVEYEYDPKIEFILPKDLFSLEDLSFFRPRASDRVRHVGGQARDPELACTAEGIFPPV